MNAQHLTASLSRTRRDGVIFETRKAGRRDIPAMRAMQERSMRILGSHYYMRSEIEAFLSLVGTMDDAVVDEGHFFLAADRAGNVIGSGAWSAAPSATVHGVFVAPERTRRGIAHAIMQRIEAEVAAAGRFQLQLTATLSGEAFYRAMGYQAEPRSYVVLPDGTRFGCVKMRKPFAAAASSAA